MAEEAKAAETETETTESEQLETGSDFKPIETQEDFDKAVKSRIERAKQSVRKEFDGFADYKAKAEKYDTETKSLKAQIKELEAKVGEYETNSEKKAIAKECGLPESLAQRLSGSNPDEWRKDAKELKKIFGRTEPSRNQEHLSQSSESLELLRAIRGK